MTAMREKMSVMSTGKFSFCVIHLMDNKVFQFNYIGKGSLICSWTNWKNSTSILWLYQKHTGVVVWMWHFVEVYWGGSQDYITD